MRRMTFSFDFDQTFSLALQSVEHRIGEIASSFKPFNFVRGDWREISMKMEKTPAPFIVLFTPEGGEVTETGAWDRDSVRLRLGFFDIVNREAYAEDNMAVGKAMQIAGQMFIKAMNESGYFEPISSKPYTYYYESFTCHATGCVFSLTVKQAEGVCIPVMRSNDNSTDSE